jgi:hypothetical protein
LRKPLTDPQRDNKTAGNNYIFEVVTRTGDKIYKIGITDGTIESRRKSITHKCRHLKIKQKADPDHVPIRLFKRAETLIHKELEDFLHIFDCECGVAHKEYFAIKKEMAIEAVQRWRSFCKREPYNENGELQPFWEHRLKNMRRCDTSETIMDFKRRSMRWNEFMNPTELDILRFLAGEVLSQLWPCRWQAISFVQGLALTLVCFPSLMCFLIFVVICCGMFVEMSQLELPYIAAVVKQTLESRQLWSSPPELEETTKLEIGDMSGEKDSKVEALDVDGMELTDAGQGKTEVIHIEESESSNNDG